MGQFDNDNLPEAEAEAAVVAVPSDEAVASSSSTAAEPAVLPLVMPRPQFWDTNNMAQELLLQISGWKAEEALWLRKIKQLNPPTLGFTEAAFGPSAPIWADNFKASLQLQTHGFFFDLQVWRSTLSEYLQKLATAKLTSAMQAMIADIDADIDADIKNLPSDRETWKAKISVWFKPYFDALNVHAGLFLPTDFAYAPEIEEKAVDAMATQADSTGNEIKWQIIRREVSSFIGGATLISALQQVLMNAVKSTQVDILKLSVKTGFTHQANIFNHGVLKDTVANLPTDEEVVARCRSAQFTSAEITACQKIYREYRGMYERFFSRVEIISANTIATIAPGFNKARYSRAYELAFEQLHMPESYFLRVVAEMLLEGARKPTVNAPLNLSIVNKLKPAGVPQITLKSVGEWISAQQAAGERFPSIQEMVDAAWRTLSPDAQPLFQADVMPGALTSAQIEIAATAAMDQEALSFEFAAIFSPLLSFDLRADTVRAQAVKLFRNKLSAMKKADGIITLVLAAKPAINRHRNPLSDYIVGRKHTATWKQVLKEARMEALKLIQQKIEALKGTNDLKAIAALREKIAAYCKHDVFAGHRNESYITGAWGSTATVKALRKMDAQLLVMRTAANDTDRDNAVCVFKAQLASKQTVAEVKVLLQETAPLIKKQRNDKPDAYETRQNTLVYLELMKAARLHAVEIVKAKAKAAVTLQVADKSTEESASVPLENKEATNKLSEIDALLVEIVGHRKDAFFSTHRNTEIIKGAWGRTSSVKALDDITAQLQQAHKKQQLRK